MASIYIVNSEMLSLLAKQITSDYNIQKIVVFF